MPTITEKKFVGQEAVEQLVTNTRSEINDVKDHADDLNSAMSDRVTALETWHENFEECSDEEINALFV